MHIGVFNHERRFLHSENHLWGIQTFFKKITDLKKIYSFLTKRQILRKKSHDFISGHITPKSYFFFTKMTIFIHDLPFLMIDYLDLKVDPGHFNTIEIFRMLGRLNVKRLKIIK